MASGLENALFQLKFTAKSLNRQAVKAGKDEQAEKAKVEKAIKAGHEDIARIHAQNAVRKQTEKINLLQLAGRVDAVASRVQTASTMKAINTNMMKVNRSLDFALKSMNPEAIATAMIQFESSFEQIDSTTQLYNSAAESATATATPQEDIDRLMSQAADKVGVELKQDLEDAPTSQVKILTMTPDQELLSDRLRALRN